MRPLLIAAILVIWKADVIKKILKFLLSHRYPIYVGN